VLRAGSLALRGNDPAYGDLLFANNRLGAGSSARLFQLLRIEKGYTYGAGSTVPRMLEPAPFVAATSVRANVTLESLRLIREQLSGYGATYTAEDLETTRNLLLKGAARRFETLGDLAGVLEAIGDHDLALDWIAREQERVRTITLDEVRAAIGRYIDESRMVYLVVGDGATQLERVAGLGLGPPRRLDRSGAPI